MPPERRGGLVIIMSPSNVDSNATNRSSLTVINPTDADARDSGEDGSHSDVFDEDHEGTPWCVVQDHAGPDRKPASMCEHAFDPNSRGDAC